LLFYQTQLYVI